LVTERFILSGFFNIRSKTGVSVNELGDQYVLLGPYIEQKAKQEVEEEDFPFHHPLGQVEITFF
jgi:hypothetical protein